MQDLTPACSPSPSTSPAPAQPWALASLGSVLSRFDDIFVQLPKLAVHVTSSTCFNRGLSSTCSPPASSLSTSPVPSDLGSLALTHKKIHGCMTIHPAIPLRSLHLPNVGKNFKENTLSSALEPSSCLLYHTGSRPLPPLAWISTGLPQGLLSPQALESPHTHVPYSTPSVLPMPQHTYSGPPSTPGPLHREFPHLGHFHLKTYVAQMSPGTIFPVTPHLHLPHPPSNLLIYPLRTQVSLLTACSSF